MDNKIYFSIPGYYSHYKLNIVLLEVMKYHKEKFNDDIIIDSAYDCFPGCIWNGGRPIRGYVEIEEVEKIMEDFNKRGVSIRHTFTNALLQQEHFFDSFGNFILKESSKTTIKTGITLNSPLLKEYIENKYPNQFYFNWSATKCLSDIDEINKLSENNLVIPSYQDINNKWDKINQLEHLENIELIVDEACVDDCPYKNTHYLIFNVHQIYQNNKIKGCAFNSASPNYYERRTNKKHNISIENIRENYLPKGINKFKIAGREENDINLIETYVNYFVKPEHRDFIRNELLLAVIIEKKPGIK